MTGNKIILILIAVFLIVNVVGIVFVKKDKVEVEKKIIRSDGVLDLEVVFPDTGKTESDSLNDSPKEFIPSQSRGIGRGMGAGRGRGLGIGAQDGKGGGRSGRGRRREYVMVIRNLS